MRTYNTQHLHYCGVDLHARSLFVNVLDDKGRTRLEQDLPASPSRVPRRRQALPRRPRRRLRVHVRLVLARRPVRTRGTSPSSSATPWT